MFDRRDIEDAIAQSVHSFPKWAIQSDLFDADYSNWWEFAIAEKWST